MKALLVLIAITLIPSSFLAAQGVGTSSAGSNSSQGNSETVSPVGDELNWPRIYTDNNATIAIYQPEIEKWDGETLETRAAVAITPAGTNKPVYGVVWIKARTEVDKAAGIVTLNDVKITKSKFPTVRNPSDYLAMVRSHISTAVQTVALAHLESSYAVSEAVKKARSVPVKNDPPQIIYTTTPSLLILVDGSPVLRTAPGQPDVRRVVNTRAFIALSNGGYYLYAAGHWYWANDIGGPWQPATEVPISVATLKDNLAAARQVDLMASTNNVAQTPSIYVSTTEAELIQSDGPANLVAIPGTDLVEVKNSDNAVFMDLDDQNYYALISGRWFKADSLNGPWTYVPYEKLPLDFARIPADDPKANALASVKGTPQAEETAIADQIPQTAAVNRTETKDMEASYDGDPQFQGIDGTPLSYAVNCQTPVIEVSPTVFYGVENGIWFIAASPFGPWAVAASVPPVIYSIPPSCPIHYVTYVRIYGSTPEVVYEGYTPGYFGTVLCPDYIVVYGTGWYYPPYIGSVWVGWPCTYGFGASFACGMDIGFGFGFAAGFAIGTWCHPWWGPFDWGWRHGMNFVNVSINHVNIYHTWNRDIVRETHNYAFNSWRGGDWSRAWGNHFNPYSSHRQAREAPGQFHAYSGNIRTRPEISQAFRSPRALTPTGRSVTPSPPLVEPRAPLIEPHPSVIEPRNSFLGNNLYSDHAGNVYRFNPTRSGLGEELWQRVAERAAGASAGV